ncbi:MAG: SET domain-containing protein [Candidatus Omnitrophica bacterium]|nr:SET domain-containing protein [Candidatus Omnitrophota bacterium]
MLAKLFDVKETKDKGKGLFAKEFIPKGTIVCFECKKCKSLTAAELGFDKMSEAEKMKLLDWAYRKKDGTFVAPCDETKYINHSCNANVLGTEFGFDIAVRDIKKGEEATYDYRDFYDDVKMPCMCGEPNCCKVVTFMHPVPEELKEFWDKKVNSALKLVNKVKQPLNEALRENGIVLPIVEYQ